MGAAYVAECSKRCLGAVWTMLFVVGMLVIEVSLIPGLGPMSAVESQCPEGRKMVIDKAIRVAVKEHRKNTVEWNDIRVPGSVPFLEQLLTAETDPFYIDEILTEIWSEYVRADLAHQQLETVRRRAKNLPDDILVKLALADQLSHLGVDSVEYSKEAKDLIVEVVASARERNEWVRYSLSEQARIGRRLNDPEMFVTALQDLMADVKSGREFEVDSRIFGELIDDIPNGFCKPEIIEKYRELIEELGSSAA
jgi:hypothetical protein